MDAIGKWSLAPSSLLQCFRTRSEVGVGFIQIPSGAISSSHPWINSRIPTHTKAQAALLILRNDITAMQALRPVKNALIHCHFLKRVWTVSKSLHPLSAQLDSVSVDLLVNLNYSTFPHFYMRHPRAQPPYCTRSHKVQRHACGQSGVIRLTKAHLRDGNLLDWASTHQSCK